MTAPLPIADRLRPLPHWRAKEWDDLIDRAKHMHSRDAGLIPNPLLANKMRRVAQVLNSMAGEE